MRLTDNTKPVIFGFILAIGIILTLPHFAFGAARSFGGPGRFKAGRMQRPFGAHLGRVGTPQIQRQPSFLHDLDTSVRVPRKDFFPSPFYGYGFGGGVAVSEHPVVIIQQVQPAAITEPREPATNRVYIQPRWVDGGHGVEVLQPGYWTEPKQASQR